MAALSSESTRLLSYMAAWAPTSANWGAVVRLMDQLANSPGLNGQVDADRRARFGVPFATASLAQEAVHYAEGRILEPDWIKQAGKWEKPGPLPGETE